MKRAKKIIDNVYWVGVRDLNNRHFHGDLYPIDEGCTYNAYLVVDDKVTLFDTVEEEFTEELLERVESVLQGREIDNIVVQHTEPDHSGGFKKVYAKYPNAKVYASISGKKNMIEQYFDQVPYQVVKTNDTINTGKYDFVFVEMQMIHWPDNMLTYCPQLKTVFSNDAFGQHIVNFNLTDEGLDKAYCLKQAKEYFANIVLPYTTPVQAKLNLILGMNLDIEYIMPAHGIIWKDYIADIIDDMEISQNEFATRMGTTAKTLSKLINGQANISNDLAKKLSIMLGTSVEVWQNLQNTYDQKLIEIQQVSLFAHV